MSRHPHLSLKNRVPIPKTRVAACSRESIAPFFDKYGGLLEKWKLDAGSVFGMDETGFHGEGLDKEKVVVSKNCKRAYSSNSGFTQHVTALHVCNAAGASLPPIFVLQEVMAGSGMMEGTEPGAKLTMTESGYVREQHMKQIFEHIIEHTRHTHTREGGEEEGVEVEADEDEETKQRRKRKPLLLLLDGAGQHFELEALEFAYANNINVLALPPNTTHILQVSDVSVFGPLKSQERMHPVPWQCEEGGRGGHGVEVECVGVDLECVEEGDEGGQCSRRIQEDWAVAVRSEVLPRLPSF